MRLHCRVRIVVVVVIRRVANQELEQCAPEAVNVGSRIGLRGITPLFRRNIVSRAHDQIRGGHHAKLRILAEHRQSEVQQFDLSETRKH